MGIKEELIKKQLQEHDEDKQIAFLVKIACKLSTARLKKGARKLKSSNKVADIKARQVMLDELEKRGVKP